MDTSNGQGGAQGAAVSGGNENTQSSWTQTATANISTSESSNISTSESSNTGGDNWKGDHRYFQTGEKAGRLKPKFGGIGSNSKPREVGGIDAEKATGGGSLLRTDELRHTAKGSAKRVVDKNAKPGPNPAEEKAALAQQKKEGMARVSAKMTMRTLDLLVGFISGGEYGADFDAAKREKRNQYRDELEADWQAFWMTQDVAMHPGLVVAFNSTVYVAEAFETKRGQERVATISEKVGGKLFSWFFTRKNK